jgi:hypothetical protein
MSQDEHDNWRTLGDFTQRITERWVFVVPLSGELADAVRSEARKGGNRPETVIAEAVRAYLGGAQ